MSALKKRPGRAPAGQPKRTVFRCRDAAVLRSLLGENDQHLKTLQHRLDLKLHCTPDGLELQGQDSEVELAHDLLSQLKALLEQGETIFPGDFERALTLLAADRQLNLREFYRDQIVISGRKHTIVPKTLHQKQYLEAIRAKDLVFGVGPAGTGKTYLAMGMALAALMRREVKRVVLCRPAVEAGEKLGFLPGDMAEKVNPYLRPLYDALHDMLDVERGQEMIAKGLIEVAPLAFMRGRTLSQAFVILDEAQNTSKVQMKMILTRLGRDSKCVVTGDITQIDLPTGMKSGLVHALEVLRGVAGIGSVFFTEADVIRHPLVASIVEAYRLSGTEPEIENGSVIGGKAGASSAQEAPL